VTWLRRAGISRWKHPGGVFDIFTDFARGSDTTGNGKAENPFRTVHVALYRVLNEVDFWGSPGGQTQLVVNMASDTVDEQEVHLSGPFCGAQGGAAVTICGGVNSEIRTSGSAIGLFCNTIVGIQRVKLSGASGCALSVGLGAKAYIHQGVLFGPSACHIGVNGTGSHVMINADYQIWGGADYHLSCHSSGLIESVGSYTATFGCNCSFRTFAAASAMGNINIGGLAFNANSYSVTGQRYRVDSAALINTGRGDMALPGSDIGYPSNNGTYT
jgi:hypothetical protein